MPGTMHVSVNGAVSSGIYKATQQLLGMLLRQLGALGWHSAFVAPHSRWTQLERPRTMI